jgi:hypothetical protein
MTRGHGWGATTWNRKISWNKSLVGKPL